MKKINIKESINKIVNFLKEETAKANFKKVIISLSGGIDSSVCLFLAVKALGRENVLVVKMPHKDFNQDKDAELAISKLEIPQENIFEIEISEIVKSFIGSLSSLDSLRLGNIMARVRMIILYDLAKKNNALVVGTENKSEYLLGYFTRFGDQASDLEPIRNLYKSEVFDLAKYLGVPEKIINKKPSAGLWVGQTDEKELGFFYKDADPILFEYFDQRLSWEEIIKKEENKSLIKKIKDQVEKNKFKQEVPKISPA